MLSFLRKLEAINPIRAIFIKMKRILLTLMIFGIVGCAEYSSESDCIISESQVCSTEACVREVTNQCKVSEDYDWNKPRPLKKEKKLTRNELLLKVATEERLKKEAEERSSKYKLDSIDRAAKRNIELEKSQTIRLNAEKEANLVKQETFQKEHAYNKEKFWKALRCKVTNSINGLDEYNHVYHFSFFKADSSSAPQLIEYDDIFVNVDPNDDPKKKAKGYVLKQSKRGGTFVIGNTLNMSLNYSGVLNLFMNSRHQAYAKSFGLENAKTLFNDDTLIMFQLDLDNLHLSINNTDKALC